VALEANRPDAAAGLEDNFETTSFDGLLSLDDSD
jgi:hypothetical protein